MLKGKKMSILGDSLSTYKGVSDDGSANAAIASNCFFYCSPMPLEKTYWMIVAAHLGMSLCVNNSYSGANLSGRSEESSGISRSKNLSRDDGTEPDVIIVSMGTNDLGRNVDINVFYNDYKDTLLGIKEKYPKAYVCCVNLADKFEELKARTIRFNAKIDEAVKEAGERFFIADVFNSCLNNDFYYLNTVDGLHPDEDGMRYIAEIVEEAIVKNCK